MAHTVALIIAMLVMVVVPTGVVADRYSDCYDAASGREKRIRACTKIIERGKRESKQARAKAYANRAFENHVEGDEYRAVVDIRKAIEIDPTNKEVSSKLRAMGAPLPADLDQRVCSNYYDANGKWVDQVISACTRLLAVQEPDKELSYASVSKDMAYAFRGWAYLKKNELNQSIADFGAAIQLDPERNIMAFHGRAEGYLKQSDYDRAIADYTKSIELNSLYDPSETGAGAAEYYEGRGRAYKKKGDAARAKADFDKAKRLMSE